MNKKVMRNGIVAATAASALAAAPWTIASSADRPMRVAMKPPMVVGQEHGHDGWRDGKFEI